MPKEKCMACMKGPTLLPWVYIRSVLPTESSTPKPMPRKETIMQRRNIYVIFGIKNVPIPDKNSELDIRRFPRVGHFSNNNPPTELPHKYPIARAVNTHEISCTLLPVYFVNANMIGPKDA